MAREPYEVNIPAPWTYFVNGSQFGSGICPDAMHAKENAGGVKRVRPVSKWIDPTHYELLFTRWSRGSGSSITEWKNTVHPFDRETYEFTGCVAGRPDFNVLNAFNECMQPWGDYDALYHASECYRKALVKMQQKKVDLGVAFAERTKTASMLAGAASKCARSVLALKGNKLQRAASILGVRAGRDLGPKRWAQKWLEWKYGWMPLVSDIKGAVEALQSRDKSDWKITTSAGHKQDLKRRITSGAYGSKCSVSVSGFAGVKVRVDCVPPDDLLASLNSVGLINAANTAWELIPYSFVVDWFVPVGSWIESLGALALSEGGVVCTSRICKMEWSSFGLDDSGKYASYDVTYRNSFEATKRYVNLIRVVSPMGFPSFPSPRQGVNSLQRMASALSLLVVAFAK